MTWIQTFSGKKFDFLSPCVEDIDIESIAHALSLIPRFGGHVDCHYSVAQHSIFVEGIVVHILDEPELALEALLHDAAEAYTGDIVRPLKRIITDISDVVVNVERAVAKAFNQPWPMSESVKIADNMALAAEAKHLFAKGPLDDWHLQFSRSIIVLGPVMSPQLAEKRFLEDYYLLKEVEFTCTTKKAVNKQ